MEDTENVDTESKSKRSYKKLFRNGTVLLLAFICGVIHYKYVSTLHENHLHFSHLSELERELTLYSELGFYYSYYKTVVVEKPFIAGISKLMYDKLVEYPNDVNAFNRFNIFPEVIIGSVYRYLEPWLNTTAHRQCHMIDRGPDLTPVQSCVGLGEPIMFYLEAVWVLAGFTMAVVFLHGTMLSGTVLGGVLAITQYIANHAHCTRVQHSPNQRENFAAPLLFLQAWLVGTQLRDVEKRTSFHLQISIFLLNCTCLLFWQFTQFIFLTQTAIFFLMEQLRIIDLKTLCVFLHSHFCGLHTAVLLLQGNDMLKSSMYTSFFLTVSAYAVLFSGFRVKVLNRTDLLVESWLVLLRICLVVTASVYVKKIISEFLNVDEDSHIWEILLSKLTSYKSFFSLLYTSSEAFDFMSYEDFGDLIKTLLIPMVVIVIANEVYSAVRGAVRETERIEGERRKEDEDADDSGIENNAETGIKKKDERADLDVIEEKVKVKYDPASYDRLVTLLKAMPIDSATFYTVCQMCAYGVMAALVMRLQLLFVPQMCIVSSLLVARRGPKSKLVPILWAVCIATLLRRLYENVAVELSREEEFSNPDLEELITWAMGQSAPGAWAGAVPGLSALLLSARKPLAAHPHLEHANARRRMYAVYKMYGRFSPEELYEELNKLKVSYLVVEKNHCYGRSSRGWSLEEIWDIEAPAHAHRPKLCHALLTRPQPHFHTVFSGRALSVLRVHDLSVRYMPRCFDT